MKSIFEIYESVLKSNDAGNPRFYFSLYKDAFPDPMISIGIDALYQDYTKDALDMDKVNKLYNKIPKNAKIESKDIQGMKKYLIHSKYWKDWEKLTNIILYCKTTKEIQKIVDDVYTKGTFSKADLSIQKGEKWISVDAVPSHSRLEGVNMLNISMFNESNKNFPLMTFKIYMYDEKSQKEVKYWTD